jgi:hypothetical protein
MLLSFLLDFHSADLTEIFQQTDWSLFPKKVAIGAASNVSVASSSRYLEFLLLESYTPAEVGKFMRGEETL